MNSHFLQYALHVILAMCLLTSTATAQGQQCDSCGEEIVCKKVCCLKCDFIEVQFKCWKSEFEDICVPCMSTKCGEQCVSGCSCKDGSDSCGKKKIFGIWQPAGAEIKTRRRLKFKTMTKKVPSFKWEVQSRCHACCRDCMHAPHTLPEELPALPEGVSIIDISQVGKQVDKHVGKQVDEQSGPKTTKSVSPSAGSVSASAPLRTVAQSPVAQSPVERIPPVVSSEEFGRERQKIDSLSAKGFAPRVAETSIDSSSGLSR